MSELLVHTHDGIVRIFFNRVEKSNSISKLLMEEFYSVLKRIQKDPNVRILVLQGAGEKSFCAGADLKERAGWTEKDVKYFLDLFRKSLRVLEKIPYPTISMLNGFALGGGLEIALATDIRYAKDSATLGLTETSLGIIPGAGGTQRLSRLIGTSKAKELIFTASRIDAKKALELGIVTEVFASETYKDELEKKIESILNNAPIAIKLAKKAIDEGIKLSLEKSLDLEHKLYSKTLTTEDRKEALAAFQEKRKPNFKGE
ncbi:MAG: enoyl-CoA hydratase-related protein [Leptospiraceae bacterium]|nr:enoyl-CoA hydratase-related protein [Leptospiraceae bacterium]